MSFSEFVSSLRRRWVYVVALVFFGGGLGVAAFTYAVPTYQANASVYFTVPIASSAGDLAQGGDYTQQQLASYAELATKPIVLNPVIARLSLSESAQELARSVSASVSKDTVLTTITVGSTSPERAATIANAIAEQLGKTVTELSPKTADGKDTVEYAIAGHAVPPRYRTSPKKKVDLGAGLLGGLLVGLCAALIRDRLDTRIWDESDLSGLPALARIPFDKARHNGSASALVPDWTEGSARAEAFRQLRTTLQYVDVDHPIGVLTITSSVSAEGKSSVTANLAVAFAEAGHRVLLIDADLRRPSVAGFFKLDGAIGLTNVLAGQASCADVIQLSDHDHLYILPAGSVPPNPSELLGSRRMADLLTTFRSEYDVVLIDTPPLLPVTDAAVISVKSDGALLIVRHGKTRRAELAASVKALEAVDARIVGAVINRTPVKKRGALSYYGTVTDGRDPMPSLMEPDSQPDKTSTPGHAAQDTAESILIEVRGRR